MNYRQHYFLLNVAAIIGVVIGGFVWFVEASVRMFSAGVAKMPFESISWHLYVYPMIGGALVWLLVRFPLMARCDACKTKLRFYRMGSPRYACPACGAQYAVGAPVEGEPEHSATQPSTATGWAKLRQRLYPNSDNGAASWKMALGALCVLALLSLCIPLKSLEVDVMGIAVPKPMAAHIAWVAWALMNLYLLIGIIWSLAAPEDQPTAALSRGRRGLFMALGLLCVAVSLLVPVLR